MEFSLIAKIAADSLLSAGFAMVLVRRSCKADVRVLRRVLRRFYDCTIQPLSHSDIGNPKGASRQVIVDGGRL